MMVVSDTWWLREANVGESDIDATQPTQTRQKRIAAYAVAIGPCG
mgnify:CR=1 FL=1